MSLSLSQQIAREALKARQGSGARYDAANAPFEDLLLARRGAAHFARKLNELTDEELNEPALKNGWTRGQVIADVSYRAREVAVELKRIREGGAKDKMAWNPDLNLATTLPARALRHLYTHSNIHLNVEFRDLTKENWPLSVELNDGAYIPIKRLPFLRARKLWWGVVALNNGSFSTDIPEVFK